MTIAIDSETKLIQAGVLAPEMVCLTWAADDLESHILHANDPRTEPLLESWFKGDELLVLANGAFDLLVVARKFPRLLPWIFSALRRGIIRDVQLDQRLIDLARGELDGYADHHGVWHKTYYSVDALSQRYGFGKMEKDQWRLRYGELIPYPVEEWNSRMGVAPGAWGPVEYAKLDAVRTRQIHGAQSVYSDWLKDSCNQARAAFALHLMSDEGMRTDAKACAEYIEEIEFSIQQAAKDLRAAGLLRESGTKNTKAAKARMVEVMSRLGDIPEKTAGGDISLSYEACRDSLDPLLQAYALYSSSDTMRKRVRKLSQGSKQKLQTAFVVMKKNGRTSSRTPQPPLIGENLQNLPAFGKLRECFIPGPDEYLCSVDFNQFELCTLAQVQYWEFGTSRMRDAINAKRDLHSMLAAQLLGKTYEWVIANKHLPEVKLARALCKRANFGLGGGMGIARFMATVNGAAETPEERITERRTRELREAWLDFWDMRPYFAWVSELTQDGPATLVQYVSGRVRGHVGYCDLANGTFSGLAADAIKSCLLPLAEEAYVDQASAFYGSRPLLLIHDEILAAVPKATAHEAAYRQAELMINHVQANYVPDVRVTAKPCIMERWYKDADEVLVDGRLVPWTPDRRAA